MAEVQRTPAAHEDLLQIWLHMAQDHSEAADRFLDNIDRKCQLLATQPHMGRSRSDLGRGVRGFPVGDYLVLYHPIDGGIEVLRVIHGSRDVPAVFRKRRS
ncbi:MAG: type II toxin-antitoxin system RelE/ParE family toxin [Phycisphaerae bacterium]